MTADELQKASEKFYRSLTAKSRFKLYAAFFFVLAPVQVLSVTNLSGPLPWWTFLAHVCLSGLLAVVGAFAVIQKIRLVFFVGPAFFASFIVLVHFAPAQPTLKGLVCAGLIITGWFLFVSFINREGATSLRLQTEVALAQEIHRKLVPAISVSVDDFEFCGGSLPSSEVGGDLLDLVTIGPESEKRYGLLVADISGHGVSAGVLMAMVKSAVHTKLLHEDPFSSLLDDLNDVVYKLSDESKFVTCACVEIAGSSAAYALAGHPPILHYDFSDGRVRRLSEASFPLGLFPFQRSSQGSLYRWRPFQFDAGDLLILLTDGITEVTNANGQELGLEAIEALVQGHASLLLGELYELILSTVQQHGPRSDDQTLLLARRRGG